MKGSIKTYLRDELKKLLFDKFNPSEIEITPITNQNFGDYTTNVAFKIAKETNRSPVAVADDLVKKISLNNFKKIENINGFINFWLKDEVIFEKLNQLKNNSFSPETFFFGPYKKIVIEYAQPNTHKLFHIGHLRNITIGESLARLFEFLGNRVFRVNYQGDVGLHIAKTLYAILSNQQEYQKVKKAKNLTEKIAFIGKMYTLGNQKYEEDQKAQKQIININQMIYQNERSVYSLWQETRQWSLEYFDEIYKQLDTKFDKLYFESQTTTLAKKFIDLALKKHILEKSQGAVIFNGKKYGLDTRVFLNSLGFPTYEGKEIPLAHWEFTDFGKIDKCIHLTTPEQKSFFNVTFKVEELLFPEIKGKQYHLAYQWVNLKTGKMSSRQGNIIEANWLIKQIKNKILTNYQINDKNAHILSIACVKYAFLKNSPQTTIDFDIDESINIHGNSAAYLIYSFVRCQSIIKKIKKVDKNDFYPQKEKLSIEEKNLARLLSFFEEIVYQSAASLAPQLLTNYLFQVAQKFNLFYEKYPVLTATEPIKNFRLSLTFATANVLKKGLALCGIKTINKM